MDQPVATLKEDALPRIATGEAHLWAMCLKATPHELIGVIEFRVARDDERAEA